jgi:hypothetical protein
VEYKTLKKGYQVALIFQRNLSLARENNEAGIRANLVLGMEYQKCVDTTQPENKAKALESAANYYVAALTLARCLNRPFYVDQAMHLLEKLGRNKKGEGVTEPECAAPLASSLLKPF